MLTFFNERFYHFTESQPESIWTAKHERAAKLSAAKNRRSLRSGQYCTGQGSVILRVVSKHPRSPSPAYLSNLSSRIEKTNCINCKDSDLFLWISVGFYGFRAVKANSRFLWSWDGRSHLRWEQSGAPCKSVVLLLQSPCVVQICSIPFELGLLRRQISWFLSDRDAGRFGTCHLDDIYSLLEARNSPYQSLQSWLRFFTIDLYVWVLMLQP